MSAPICKTVIPSCPGWDDVLLGYSSEATDTVDFIGLGFGSNTPPPLGIPFVDARCFATAHSAVSQEDADAVALAEADACITGQLTPSQPLYFDDFPDDIFMDQVGGVNTPPLT